MRMLRGVSRFELGMFKNKSCLELLFTHQTLDPGKRQFLI